MGINPDPSCHRATDPEETPGSILGQMTLGGSIDHSDQYGPSSGMALRHQHGLRWLARSWTSPRPSVVTGAWISVNSDPGCCRALDSDMVLGSNLGADVTLALVTSGPHLSACFSRPSPLQLCLIPQHTDPSAYLSLPFLHHMVAHHNGTYPPSACGCLSPTWAEWHQAGLPVSWKDFYDIYF